MPIDSSIPLSIKAPQIDDYAAVLGRAQQLQNMRTENMLNNLKMQSAQQEMQNNNKLRELFASPGADSSSPDFQRKLLGLNPDLALKIQKQALEGRKAESDISKDQLSMAKDKTALFRDALDGVNNPNDAAQWLSAQYQDPILGDMMSRIRPYDRAIAAIPTTPEGFQQWKQQAALGMSKFLELNKPHVMTQDLGGTSQIVATPGLGGAPQVLSSANKTMSPEAIAANARGWADIATKREANQVAREATASQRLQNTEMKMADDYRADSKGFGETATSIRKVMSALDTADKNPGSALAAGTAFMKILDPNSVVRESELGMALNASGWFDRATNIANQLQNGKVMTKNQTVALKSAAQNLFDEAKAAQREIDAAYKTRAAAYGANPNNVIIDRGQNSTTSKNSGGLDMSAIEAEMKRRGLK